MHAINLLPFFEMAIIPSSQTWKRDCAIKSGQKLTGFQCKRREYLQIFIVSLQIGGNGALAYQLRFRLSSA